MSSELERENVCECVRACVCCSFVCESESIIIFDIMKSLFLKMVLANNLFSYDAT